MCRRVECVFTKRRACCVQRVVGGERARGYCYEAEPMSMMMCGKDVCGGASGARAGGV